MVETEVSGRIRWHIQGAAEGPLLVLFAGIHGNEPAGIRAIDGLAEELMARSEEFLGTLYVITGNQRALELGVRYIDTDLNRLWERVDADAPADVGVYRASPEPQGLSEPSEHAGSSQRNEPSEYAESREIRQTIDEILRRHASKASDIIFSDLHTTSSESCAFILINDTLANRRMARKFPLPQILGIEENIQGTLLSYINNLGYKSIGFEAGAHDSEASVTRTRAFLKLLLHNSGILLMDEHKKLIEESRLEVYESVPADYYQIKHHQYVEDPRKFHMKPGFENFDSVQAGQLLATEDNEEVTAPMDGRIFMPLYQEKGHDGFLIIRKVPLLWIGLSAYLRGDFTHSILQRLPGVSVAGPRALRVDLSIARFFVKDIFHLLGYRVTRRDESTLICHRR
jgi:succinylglutamate desuccinylase